MEISDVIFDKKIIIWDLDNTLYEQTKEFSDMLDGVMAEVLVEDLGVDLDYATCKAKVKESYAIHRDGGEVFYRDYGILPKDLLENYFRRKPVEKITPYSADIAKKIIELPIKQYVFTASNRYASEKILKHIGLYEMFKDKFYSVEDFGVYKKNESSLVYKQFCDRIGVKPQDCVFVDDSYSNLEFAKEAGMTTVRIYYNENSAKDKTYIDYAYKGLESFLDALNTNAIAAQ